MDVVVLSGSVSLKDDGICFFKIPVAFAERLTCGNYALPYC